LKKRYVLVPICPEQLGGMPTPRTGEKLHGTGAQVLDEGLRVIAPETGKDVTGFHVNGAEYALAQLPQLVVRIVDFSAKTKKVFTTFPSFYFPPAASERASIDPAVVATRPDDRSAR
jgi:hypothetical protein